MPTRRSKQLLQSSPKLSPSLTPTTPPVTSPRRSTRLTSLAFTSDTPQKASDEVEKPIEDSLKETPGRNGDASNLKKTATRRSISYVEETRNDSQETPRRGNTGGEVAKTPKSARKGETSTSKEESHWTEVEVSFSPVSPDQLETKKRRRNNEKTVVTRSMTSKDRNFETKKKRNGGGAVPKKRMYYKKVVYDAGEFEVGDDVYVKRREDVSSDDEDPEVEDCMVCFKSGRAVMIECDDCLGGFHLKCLKPPLKEVPEGDWICGFCEARKLGKPVQLPAPPEGKKRVRTMKEKLLSSDLWAGRIERYFIVFHLFTLFKD